MVTKLASFTTHWGAQRMGSGKMKLGGVSVGSAVCSTYLQAYNISQDVAMTLEGEWEDLLGDSRISD